MGYPPTNAPRVALDESLTRSVARLARLELSDTEVQAFTKQLADVIGYVNQLQEVNVEGVEPLQHPLDSGEATPLREDVVVPPPCDDEGHPKILASAPDVLDDSYKVPPIL